MRDPITIGRYHSAPPRRVLRSLNSGYTGDWQSWAGTPRQMRRLASVAERDPWIVRAAEAALRVVMIAAVGFLAGILMAGLQG